MTQMFLGLHAKPQSLHVPDISTILRKSLLNQKPAKGTLITDHGIEQLDYTMSPCATHPEFFLRIRSFIISIAFIVIATPDFFTFETALELVDYIFEAINCRPDGRRPGLMQLTSCYLAMFGDYARTLQNDGTTLEAWLMFKGNWQHIWRDAASADLVDSSGRAESSSNNLNIPDDLTSQLKTANSLMKGMQSTFDRKLTTLQNVVNKQKNGNKGGGKDKKRNYWSQSGPGNGQGNGQGNGGGGKATDKQSGKGAGGRKVQARGFSGNRGKRTKGGQ